MASTRKLTEEWFGDDWYEQITSNEPAKLEPAGLLNSSAEEAIARLPRATGLLRRWMARGSLPGAQLFVSLGGEVVANCGMGWARSEVPMTAESLCGWLCCSKPLGAAAVVSLWEQGELDIEAPVAEYVPEFARGGKGEFTIRHLLTHTTSIPVHADPAAPLVYGPREALLEAIYSFEVDRSVIPGRVANYSIAWAWCILSEIVRRKTGAELNLYAQRALLDPLGLEVWLGPEHGVDGGSDHHFVDVFNCIGKRPARRIKGVLSSPNRKSNPINTLRASASQIGRFLEFLLDGRGGGNAPPLSAQSRLAMTSRQRVGLRDFDDTRRIDYGFGLQLESRVYGEEGSLVYCRHASSRAFGHHGFPGLIVLADPDARMVVAVCMNSNNGLMNGMRRGRALLSAIYEDFDLCESGEPEHVT